VFSSDCITAANTAAPASDWLFASASSSAMAVEFGSSQNQAKAQPSSSPSLDRKEGSESQTWNLLLAEDNLPDALLVREAIRLENLSVNIHPVLDGEEAIAYLTRIDADENAGCPDIIVLDLNLPRNDGFDVLRHLRASARCANTPVLVVTSSDAPNDRRQAAELGAAYFRKPPSYPEFLKLGAEIRRILADAPID